MAECHPVGFQWVMEAKARGATIIHVDPRFTRTSAVADLHVPLRAGSDIAFLGALINHVLAEEKYFREYVVAYTNAATILREDFRGPEDLDGLFSGFDPKTHVYDTSSWQYEGMTQRAAAGARDTPPGEDPRDQQETADIKESSQGHAHGSGGPTLQSEPAVDPTLEHPRCVFQVLKRHFARYTPELVEQVCGIPAQLFAQVADALTHNSGREQSGIINDYITWMVLGLTCLAGALTLAIR